MEEKELDT